MPDRSIRPSSAGGSQRRKQARPPWRSPTMIHPHATSSSASDELEAALRLEHAAAAIAKEVNKIRRRTKVLNRGRKSEWRSPGPCPAAEQQARPLMPVEHAAKIPNFHRPHSRSPEAPRRRSRPQPLTAFGTTVKPGGGGGGGEQRPKSAAPRVRTGAGTPCSERLQTLSLPRRAVLGPRSAKERKETASMEAARLVPTFDARQPNSIIMSRAGLRRSRGALWGAAGTAEAADQDATDRQRADAWKPSSACAPVLNLPTVATRPKGNGGGGGADGVARGQSQRDLARARIAARGAFYDPSSVVKAVPVRSPSAAPVGLDRLLAKKSPALIRTVAALNNRRRGRGRGGTVENGLTSAATNAEADAESVALGPCADLDRALQELALELEGHVDSGLKLGGEKDAFVRRQKRRLVRSRRRQMRNANKDGVDDDDGDEEEDDDNRERNHEGSILGGGNKEWEAVVCEADGEEVGPTQVATVVVDEDALWGLVRDVTELPLPADGIPYTADELSFTPFPSFDAWQRGTQPTQSRENSSGGKWGNACEERRQAPTRADDTPRRAVTAASPTAAMGAAGGAGSSRGVAAALAKLKRKADDVRTRQRGVDAAWAMARCVPGGVAWERHKAVEQWLDRQRRGYLEAAYHRARVLYRRSGQVLSCEESLAVRDARGALAFLSGKIYRGYPDVSAVEEEDEEEEEEEEQQVEQEEQEGGNETKDGHGDEEEAMEDEEYLLDSDDDAITSRGFGLTRSGKVSAQNLWIDCCGLAPRDRAFLMRETNTLIRWAGKNASKLVGGFVMDVGKAVGGGLPRPPRAVFRLLGLVSDQTWLLQPLGGRVAPPGKRQSTMEARDGLTERDKNEHDYQDHGNDANEEGWWHQKRRLCSVARAFFADGEGRGIACLPNVVQPHCLAPGVVSGAETAPAPATTTLCVPPRLPSGETKSARRWSLEEHFLIDVSERRKDEDAVLALLSPVAMAAVATRYANTLRDLRARRVRDAGSDEEEEEEEEERDDDGCARAGGVKGIDYDAHAPYGAGDDRASASRASGSTRSRARLARARRIAAAAATVASAAEARESERRTLLAASEEQRAYFCRALWQALYECDRTKIDACFAKMVALGRSTDVEQTLTEKNEKANESRKKPRVFSSVTTAPPPPFTTSPQVEPLFHLQVITPVGNPVTDPSPSMTSMRKNVALVNGKLEGGKERDDVITGERAELASSIGEDQSGSSTCYSNDFDLSEDEARNTDNKEVDQVPDMVAARVLQNADVVPSDFVSGTEESGEKDSEPLHCVKLEPAGCVDEAVYLGLASSSSSRSPTQKGAVTVPASVVERQAQSEPERPGASSTRNPPLKFNTQFMTFVTTKRTHAVATALDVYDCFRCMSNSKNSAGRLTPKPPLDEDGNDPLRAHLASFFEAREERDFIFTPVIGSSVELELPFGVDWNEFSLDWKDILANSDDENRLDVQDTSVDIDKDAKLERSQRSTWKTNHDCGSLWWRLRSEMRRAEAKADVTPAMIAAEALKRRYAGRDRKRLSPTG